MSEACMPFQPAIEEPSNAWPSSNLLIPIHLTGTPTCCSLPRVSVKRKSTNFTSRSLISFNTSLADIDISQSPKKLTQKTRTNILISAPMHQTTQEICQQLIYAAKSAFCHKH